MEEDYIFYALSYILRRISQVSQKAQTRASKALIFKKTLTDYVFKVIIEIYIFVKKNELKFSLKAIKFNSFYNTYSHEKVGI